MRYSGLQRLLPPFLRRYILHVEARIEDAVTALAEEIPAGARVLDAGAGESRHAARFTSHRYVGVDMAVGDPGWDYGNLDIIGDLSRLPLSAGAFDACLNIVTLEHVPEPSAVLGELFRVLKPGGRLLLVVPHAWEIHQAPHDYFRYTRHGARYLLEKAGFTEIAIQPTGGFFRLLARRLLNALQFFPVVLLPVAALFLVPPALLLPLFDSLDHDKNFTLAYLCHAQKPS